MLGVMSAYAAWKSLEWGLAKDLTPYTWIGFEEELVQRKEERKDGGAEGETHGKHYWHRMRDAKHLYALRSQAAANDGPIAILSSTFHLLTAMRGVGWAFGPSPRSRSRPLPRAPLPFLLRLLFELLWSHVVLVLACITLTSSSPTRTAFISSHLPSLSPSSTSLLSETLAGLSLGITAYAGLTAGYWTAVLPAFLLTTLARLLPSGIRPPPFDSRQYPPLFMAPWCPTSVSHFWRSSWHAFFTRPFRFLAFDPVDRILRAVGGKELGRVGGTIAVFAMSAWLHEQGEPKAFSTCSRSSLILSHSFAAIWSATIHLPPFDPPLSFVNRWGASIYFVLQGVAVVLEGAFAKLTGRRVSGPLGFLWALPWMGGLGALVYQSWCVPPFLPFE